MIAFIVSANPMSRILSASSRTGLKDKFEKKTGLRFSY